MKKLKFHIFFLIISGLCFGCHHTNEPEIRSLVICLGSGFYDEPIFVQLDNQVIFNGNATTQDDGFAWISGINSVAPSYHRIKVVLTVSSAQDSISVLIDKQQSYIASYNKATGKIDWQRVDYLIERPLGTL